MPRLDFAVSVTLRGPFITQASGPGEPGLDAVVARDSADRLYIPGTQVQGKVKEALRELADARGDDPDQGLHRWIAAWLGEETADLRDRRAEAAGKTAPAAAESGDRLSKRTRVWFGDLQAEPFEEASSPRTRIAIDGDTGAVRKGALQVVDTPVAPGREITFQGRASALGADGTDADALARTLQKALSWVTHFGALRGIGGGRLVRACIHPAGYFQPLAPGDFPAVLALDLELRPLAPFCVTTSGVTRNTFEGESIIPGGAIKGAIADMWQAMSGREGRPIGPEPDPDFPALSEHFSAIRVCHAFPGKPCEPRRSLAPLTLVTAAGSAADPESALCDVALLDGAALIGGAAPTFRPDWKTLPSMPEPPSAADAPLDLPEPRHELRVRTQMNPETRRARDEHLFAYDMVVPDGLVWRSRIDFGRIEDEATRNQAAAELRALLGGGLHGLGKTKTPCETAVAKVWSQPPAAPGARDDGLWIVTLQTPALLCDLAGLWDGEEPGDWDRKLHGLYDEAWRDLSAGALRLRRFFARQALAGGPYLQRRFQGRGQAYRPYTLTEARSVFVLEPVPGAGGEAIQGAAARWAEAGLDLPAAVKAAYGLEDGGRGDEALWQACPFIRQNGYGEVRVNHWIHDRKPASWEPAVRTGSQQGEEET